MTVTPPQESWLPERPEGLPPRAPSGERAWPAWIAPVALVAGFAVAFVGGLFIGIVHAIATGSDLDGDLPPGVVMGATVVQEVALIGAAVLFARLSGPVAARHFGLRAAKVLPAIGWALAAYVTFVVAAGIWGQIVDLGDSEDQLRDLGVDESTLALIGAMILVCVAAPVVEEFFFRGFFYAALRNWLGGWKGVAVAATITGVLFGAIHFGSAPAAALLPLALLGVLLCLLYERTGSLYPCIGLHAVNNALAFGIAQDWTWEIAVLVVGALAACALVVAPVALRWRGPAATPGTA